MTKTTSAQISFFPEPAHTHTHTHTHTISVQAPGPLDAAAARLASLVYVGTESFNRVCQMGELDFVAWSTRVKELLVDQGIEASEDEVEWLQEHLPYEPTLKVRIGTARKRLNTRLLSEAALPAGAIIALFMQGSIEEGVVTLHSGEVGVPTALITLENPLHFVCHRGAIFQFHESPVVARMAVCAIPGELGNSTYEAERFTLEAKEDFSRDGDVVSLKYPSLNKVFPGIFNRLHLGQGKQNTNRSIYYHAAWATQDADGKPEYRSLWSIRDGVRQRTWKCPQLPSADRPTVS